MIGLSREDDTRCIKPPSSSIEVESTIRLTKEQIYDALTRYLRDNGISIVEIKSLDPNMGQRNELFNGANLSVVLGAAKPSVTYRSSFPDDK